MFMQNCNLESSEVNKGPNASKNLYTSVKSSLKALYALKINIFHQKSIINKTFDFIDMNIKFRILMALKIEICFVKSRLTTILKVKL